MFFRIVIWYYWGLYHIQPLKQSHRHSYPTVMGYVWNFCREKTLFLPLFWPQNTKNWPNTWKKPIQTIHILKIQPISDPIKVVWVPTRFNQRNEIFFRKTVMNCDQDLELCPLLSLLLREQILVTSLAHPKKGTTKMPKKPPILIFPRVGTYASFLY